MTWALGTMFGSSTPNASQDGTAGRNGFKRFQFKNSVYTRGMYRDLRPAKFTNHSAHTN